MGAHGSMRSAAGCRSGRWRRSGWSAGCRGRCRALGLEADADALELLAARTEGNLLAAQQELTKLALLAPERRISAQTVLASVADSARYDVFQLGESVLAGEAPRALRMLAGLRAEGTEPTLVLWALAKSLRDVWSTQPAVAAGRRPGSDPVPPPRSPRHSAVRRGLPSRIWRGAPAAPTA